MGILENVHGQGVETILDALNVGSVFSQDKSRMGRTNMSDLISREALLKVIRDDRLTNASDAIYFITNAPAINSLQNLETQGEAVTKLWESLGRWSAYLVSNGEQAELSPPAWLIDAVKNATTQQQPQSVADALEDAAKLLESQRFMALDITKTYTAEEHRQGLKSSVAFLAKKIRALIKRNAVKEGE